MYHHLFLLADLSYQIGLIGLSEYDERIRIARWLSGDLEQDPRNETNRQEEIREEWPGSLDAELSQDSRSDQPEYEPPDPMQRLVMLNHWVFTIGDKDCYPSVPHGHWSSKTTEWPKLNPYNGRVFAGMHREDASARLKKGDMQKLWRDSQFINHCRTQIQWYSGFAPLYAFPNARRGRYVFPRW